MLSYDILILNLAEHYGEGSSSMLSQLYTYLISYNFCFLVLGRDKSKSGVVALHYPSVFFWQLQLTYTYIM